MLIVWPLISDELQSYHHSTTLDWLDGYKSFWWTHGYKSCNLWLVVSTEHCSLPHKKKKKKKRGTAADFVTVSL